MYPTPTLPNSPLAPGFQTGQCAGPAEPLRFGSFPITETRSFPPVSQTQCWVYITLNAEIALRLPDSPELQSLLQTPRARVSVDGQWIWWALRWKYAQRAPAKLSGSDLIQDIAAHCAAQGQRLLLLGASAGSNAGAVLRLRQRWPGLDVAGFAPPHFAPGQAQEFEAHARSLAAVQAFEPHYVVIALGPDKQYRFACGLASELDGLVSGLFCFGGSIDMVSGQVRRAPRVLQRCGVESLYRLLQQPSRLWRTLCMLRILPRLALRKF